MAPEIITGNSIDASFSVDVWSLGCILYELLVGERLFTGKREEIVRKVLKHEFSFPTWLSLESAHLLDEMLKTKMTERISVEDILNHPWMLGEKMPEVITTANNEIEKNNFFTQANQVTNNLTRRSSSLDNFFKSKNCHFEDQIIKKIKENSENNVIFVDGKKFKFLKNGEKSNY
jgi:serine/threonine protein kinase